MSSLDDIAMRRANREVRYEDELWAQDVAHWQEEHERAAAWLNDVQMAWADAEAALRSHAQNIRDHEMRLRGHERAIGSQWWDGTETEHARMTADHEELKSRHLLMQEAHQRLRKQHEGVVTEIRELLKLTVPTTVVTETLA